MKFAILQLIKVWVSETTPPPIKYVFLKIFSAENTHIMQRTKVEIYFLWKWILSIVLNCCADIEERKKITKDEGTQPFKIL